MESVIALPWNRCPVCRGKRSYVQHDRDEMEVLFTLLSQ